MVALNEEFLKNKEFKDKLKNIIANGDKSTLTAGKIRHELETYFDLEDDALKQKPYKKIINEMIDKIMLEDDNDQTEENKVDSDFEMDNTQIKKSATQEVNRKRKASSVDPDDLTEEEDSDEEKINTPKKFKTKVSKNRSSMDSEDEDMKESNDEMELDDESSLTLSKHTKNAEKITPKKPSAKKTAAKESSPVLSDSDKVKRLKHFINKCGVRKLWSKELADCKTEAATIRKLKAMLEELGVHGRPTLEKCEAIKAERELKAELDSLDTSLIIDTGSKERPTRSTRLRSRSQNTPSYALHDDSDSDNSSDEKENKDEDKDNDDEEDVDGEDRVQESRKKKVRYSKDTEKETEKKRKDLEEKSENENENEENEDKDADEESEENEDEEEEEEEEEDDDDSEDEFRGSSDEDD
ncbi:MAG: hypothetical protein EXX96DRAFT_67086 [Benjaminiella poitrasii]|nr:MAG: hypothetical protein EXX96DRAFT_67086 [Benjaminiella poitrasii]